MYGVELFLHNPRRSAIFTWITTHTDTRTFKRNTCSKYINTNTTCALFYLKVGGGGVRTFPSKRKRWILPHRMQFSKMSVTICQNEGNVFFLQSSACYMLTYTHTCTHERNAWGRRRAFQPLEEANRFSSSRRKILIRSLSSRNGHCLLLLRCWLRTSNFLSNWT